RAGAGPVLDLAQPLIVDAAALATRHVAYIHVVGAVRCRRYQHRLRQPDSSLRGRHPCAVAVDVEAEDIGETSPPTDRDLDSAWLLRPDGVRKLHLYLDGVTPTGGAPRNGGDRRPPRCQSAG